MRGTGEAARQMLPLLRQKQKELEIMQNSNSRINVPEARNAMDQFKMQAASEEAVYSHSRTKKKWLKMPVFWPFSA